MDTVQTLNVQPLKSADIVASCYSTLDSSKGLPLPNDLEWLHTQLDSEVAKLTRIVREQSEAVKLAVKTALIKVHRALKLVGATSSSLL